MKNISKTKLVIYKIANQDQEVDVKVGDESVWLSLNQITKIFNTDKSGVSRHINNIYKEKELNKKATIAKIATVQIEGQRKIKRLITYYNLDLILSVGYRVNSQKATQFRVWATKVLRQHILQGFSLNQKRLQQQGLVQLQSALALVKKTIKTKKLNSNETTGLLEIITDYTDTWLTLQQYDEGNLQKPKLTKSKQELEYNQIKKAISQLKEELITKKQATEIFGQENNDGLKIILGAIYQSFNNQEVYPSFEEKAAHLLYLTIKDHPFVDGNKRIGSFLFLRFLQLNHKLYIVSGERLFTDNGLVATALLVAQSNPKDKDIMILLIMNLLK